MRHGVASRQEAHLGKKEVNDFELAKVASLHQGRAAVFISIIDIGGCDELFENNHNALLGRTVHNGTGLALLRFGTMGSQRMCQPDSASTIITMKENLEVDPEPVLVGTLLKRAQGKSTFGRMNWKQRWFVLYENELQWWSAEGGRYNTQAELKGAIDLASIHAVEHVSYDAFTKAHMFQLVHTSLLYIQCNTKRECDKWVSTLRKLVAHNTFLHPKFHPGFFDERDKVWSCCGIPSRDFKGCLTAHDYSPIRKELDADETRPQAKRGISSSAAVEEAHAADARAREEERKHQQRHAVNHQEHRLKSVDSCGATNVEQVDPRPPHKRSSQDALR
ncbi:uncharacterized protein MONBRDRAFT_6461 [Monosiga brevicollis MX1]|uniref:PH domain-containing protein n=1 Tax=Monosiga brevicollis TaxID=81824 RepID=A9UTY2_MONBE|nr:uncharacterized protein MONBRDRAFT_6461 [Monosiga brevicollis MX1]EDQ91573.1 predicted protein [Monosiga brevicollis MX1]|eukprot:XP_001743995.1 hypothetical protein [Monosiga brevicollis MX1]